MAAIQYIPHEAIDFKKWDDCICRSPQGLVYAYAWYLHQMSPGWHALVWGDYEAVMPLTGRRKWGIDYLYQPAFCAELGVFPKGETQKDLIPLFIAHIPHRYRYIDICLNRDNICDDSTGTVILRNNYVLSLEDAYENLKNNFSENHIRNIKKALRHQLVFDASVQPEDAILLGRLAEKNKDAYTAEDWRQFDTLCKRAKDHQAIQAVGVRDAAGNLQSAAVFFHSNHTWFYILAGSTAAGKMMGASHYLIDQFIQRHACTKTYLDFEGSDADSVAHFYRGFGAVNRPYPALVLNRLPRWIRWVKKQP
jgi:hypothetical protein